MADKPVFQEHHIIEQQAFDKSSLLQQLAKDGLINVNNPHNLLNMPADKNVAAQMGVSPHNGGPLKAYSDALSEHLIPLEETKDFQAMLSGDKAAAQRLAARVNNLRDTMRAGLINGDLLTNTPKDMSPEVAKARITEFMGDLDGYAKQHAAQIEKIATTMPDRWDAITTAEARVRAAVDAIESSGVKPSKGPAEIARNTLGGAIVRSVETGELALSQGLLQHLSQVFTRRATGVAAVSIVADIAVSTAEAKQAVIKGDTERAHSIMNGLGARLAFGWLGAEWGATVGTGVGPYGTAIGGILGGIAGLLGGESLVKAIENIADQFTGLLHPHGNKAAPAKAPEADLSSGLTIITEFDPQNNRAVSVTKYNTLGKVTALTRPEYDLQTGLKSKEQIFDGEGRKIAERNFAPGTGKLVSETNYIRSSGKVSTEITYDDAGNKTMKFFDARDGHVMNTHVYNPAGRITRQLSYGPDGSVSLDSRRSYDAVTGKQTGYQQYNQNGTLVHEGFYNPDGKENGYKSYDNNGALVKDVTLDPDTKEVIRDAVAEAKAKAKAEAEWQAAQQAEAERVAAVKAKAEADRIAGEQAVAREAERIAAEEARLKADPVGSLTDDQIRNYDKNQAFYLLNLVYNMPDKQSFEHQLHLLLQRTGKLNPWLQGRLTALVINGGKGFDPIRFPTDTPGLHPSSPSHNPNALPLPPIDWDRGIVLDTIVIQHEPPVVLDLNRDGVIDISTLSIDPAFRSGAPRFDWTGDGIADQTAWVGPNDDMLVIDLAADGSVGFDGKIDQAKEIAFALWKTEEERVAELKEKGIDDTGQPVTDLEGLRFAFDSNRDNVLDMRDERWNEFRVWQDKNQNGVADAGELLTMEQAGIRLIDLMPSKEGAKAFADGSAITGTSQAQMTDGTKMLVGDVTLAYRPSLTA